MDSERTRRVTFARTLLRLGRVSNLPTVWTNCLAAAGLAAAETSGPPPSGALLVTAAIAMSAIYTGGMFLNDAFDREHDRAHAPERPIPAGAIGTGTVLGLGLLQLLLGVVGVAFASLRFGSGMDRAAVVSAVALVLLVVLYDLWHKNNPLSPLLMAGCRALVYVTVGLLAGGGHVEPALWLGSVGVALYVVGLTWLAKLEFRGLGLRRVGGFATFIAGISLVDAIFLAAGGRYLWALLACLGFPATLALQRWVRGT